MRAEPQLAAVVAIAAVLTSGALPLSEPDVPAESPAWLLDDFESGDLVARNGAGWIGISDALAGGASQVRLKARKPGNGSRQALRVEGRLAGEKGFAGAWVALDGSGRMVDLSGFVAIRARVRAAGGVLVGVRAGRPASTNFMARAEAGPGWSTVEVPFTSLRPSGGPGTQLDPASVWFLGIQPGGAGPAFDFEVDDVALVPKPGTVMLPPSSSGVPMMARAPRMDPADVGCQGWTELASDPGGDGRAPGLPDAVGLDVCARGFRASGHPGDELWFRIRLSRPAHPDFVGANLVLDLDGEVDNGTPWWGSNKAFRFDRLVTGWVFRVGPRDQGVIGIADAAGVGRSELIDPALPTPRLAVSRDRLALYLGVPRASLGPEPDRVRMVAAVGSALVHNDDVPDASGASLSGFVR